MVRISGVDLADKYIVHFALTSIYGIGMTRAMQILEQARVTPTKRVHELTDEESMRIQKIIEKNYVVEGDLRRAISENINRLNAINSYRGSRHKQGLPARGQRTRSNARTKRGKRQTVGAMRKEERAKQTQSDKSKQA